MATSLYISKAKSSKPNKKAKEAVGTVTNVVGEQRGGNYVSRIQVGYTKQGTPRYRYFKTVEELERYRKWKNGDKAAKKLDRDRYQRVDRLKNKKNKEDNHQSGVVNSGPGKLLAGPKTVATERDKADSEVEKSLLYIAWRE